MTNDEILTTLEATILPLDTPGVVPPIPLTSDSPPTIVLIGVPKRVDGELSSMNFQLVGGGFPGETYSDRVDQAVQVLEAVVDLLRTGVRVVDPTEEEEQA